MHNREAKQAVNKCYNCCFKQALALRVSWQPSTLSMSNAGHAHSISDSSSDCVYAVQVTQQSLVFRRSHTPCHCRLQQANTSPIKVFYCRYVGKSVLLVFQ